MPNRDVVVALPVEQQIAVNQTINGLLNNSLRGIIDISDSKPENIFAHANAFTGSAKPEKGSRRYNFAFFLSGCL